MTETENFAELLNELIGISYYDPAVEHMVGFVSDIAFWIAIAGAAVRILWDVAMNVIDKFTAKASPQFIDPKVVLEVISKVVLVASFSALVPLFCNGVTWFNGLFAADYVQQAQQWSEAEEKKESAVLDMIELERRALKDKLEKIGSPKSAKDSLEQTFILKELDKLEEKEETIEGGITSTLKKIFFFLQPQNMVTLTLSFTVFILTGLIRFVILIVSVNLFKFMLILGSLSIAFSNFPMFRDKIDAWFQMTINLGFIQATIYLLDHYMFAFFYEKVSSYGSNMFADIGFNISILVMYLSLFKLTSKYAGSAEGGQIVGKAVTLTAIAAAAMISGGMAAFGSSPAMKNMMENVLSATREGFKNE